VGLTLTLLNETPNFVPLIPNRYEDKAAHFLLRLTPSLKPIGSIRAVKFQPDIGVGHGTTNGHNHGAYYKLTRLAVLKDYRKYSFGRLLVIAMHEWIKEDALHDLEAQQVATSQGTGAPGPATVKVITSSQMPVKAFYGK